MNSQRVLIRKKGIPGSGPVIYWMSRDQRVCDNWALHYAQTLALERQVPLGVVFCLSPAFLGATSRHYRFMVQGLISLKPHFQRLNIPFFLLDGSPPEVLPEFLSEHKAACLVTDYDPLRIKIAWKERVGETQGLPWYEVDAHNVVPPWIVTSKAEYAARTFRPRMYRILSQFLDEPVQCTSHPHCWKNQGPEMSWPPIDQAGPEDMVSTTLSGFLPGQEPGTRRMRTFLDESLGDYEANRNNPLLQAQSGLSPYLHFGQVSAQRVVLEVLKKRKDIPAAEAFLEEVLIRRELAENFCHYHDDYDQVTAFPVWARLSLEQHRSDPRIYRYSRDGFEQASTHDALWNAAQREMTRRGKMHGYLRMYWAKKILEWSDGPEEALETAIYLNDRYQMDGRDPNGYTGIAWSIGGVHDRPWKERSVFGKIRYMSEAGCRRKFDVDAYIQKNRE